MAWDLSFWVYMAVGSFLIVPLVEEFTARGYVLGRIRESYSGGATLVLMAVFFALAHGQYHSLEILMGGQLLLLVLGSIFLGYSVYRTGSLVPAIVAHGLTNIPLTLEWRFAAVAAGLAALISCRRAVAKWLCGLGRLFKGVRRLAGRFARDRPDRARTPDPACDALGALCLAWPIPDHHRRGAADPISLGRRSLGADHPQRPGPDEGEA